MKAAEITRKNTAFNRRYLLLAAVSVVCLAATFAVSNGGFEYVVKLAVFASIVIIYLIVCAAIYARANAAANLQKSETEAFFSEEIEAKLLALEEANQFFGASLKSADMFRLIANRINEIIPYAAAAFYMADDQSELLKAVYADGSLKKIVGSRISRRDGFVGRVFQSRQPHIEKKPRLEKDWLSGGQTKNLSTAISVPLLNGEKVFGVIVLYGETDIAFNARSLSLIEAVGERVAPLFLSSRAFENSLTNALTDALTNLPNERALFLILENQIAESQRFRGNRSLTVLAIDIKNFNELNQRFGHATGDQLLKFAADKIKNQLRQMDFLARSGGDEFLAVLPTASEEITREIIERVEKTFVINPFEASKNELVHLHLCCGAASFGKDGETASQLIKHALLRKQQAKSKDKDSKILFFPKEYVN